MRAIDTNVLVRLLTGDDPDQERAADAFIVGGAWISHLALAEAMWVLKSAYGRTPTDLINALDELLAHEHLVLQEPDVVAAALEAFRERPAAGFSDCLILATARKNGHGPLGTFDKTLAKLDGTRLL